MRFPSLRTVLLATVAVVAMGLSRSGSTSAAAAFPNDEKTIVHVLNRLGFGLRRGDVEKVQAMGLQAYVEPQPHPERMADAGISAHISGLPTSTTSSRDIADQYARPAIEARRERQQPLKDAIALAGSPLAQEPNPVQQ